MALALMLITYSQCQVSVAGGSEVTGYYGALFFISFFYCCVYLCFILNIWQNIGLCKFLLITVSYYHKLLCGEHELINRRAQMNNLCNYLRPALLDEFWPTGGSGTS